MKTLKKFLVVSAVFLLAVSFGCSKEPTAADTDDTTTLTATQQASYATLAESNSEMAIDFAKGFSGGLNSWVPPTTSKAVPGGAKVDSGWTLSSDTHTNHFNTTASSGWYYYDVIYDLDTLGTKDTIRYWVKFTDDVWANPSAVVTRVDWEMNSSESYVTTEYSAYVTKQPNDSVHSGGWYVGINTSGITASWLFTWSNVTIAGWDTNPRTCSGSFTYSGYFGVSGSFSFTNGTGSGVANCNGTQFAKFTYNNDGTGYYTLAADGYTAHHDFTW